jgi:cytochrome c-type biogenesis protein CcmH/NrfG
MRRGPPVTRSGTPRVGSAAYERRDFKLAATCWEKLLALMRPGTRQHAELSAAIERAKKRAATVLPPG